MPDLTKVSLIHAVTLCKCPRCRRDDMFANSMYGFHGQVMNISCKHCGLIYEREPGYFYVAMLISYAMNVAEMVAFALAVNVTTGSTNPWVYVIVLLTVAIFLSPFNFRYSRMILLYWLTPGIRYDPDLDREPISN